MTTDIIYKVLWVDDLVKEDGELTGFYYGWQIKAEHKNIELIPFDNWEEAECALRRDFDEFSAIILDANCKIHKNDIEQEEFITAILPSLLNIFGEKRQVLPWYKLSEGTMTNFESIIKGAAYQHLKHEEEWGNMLYIKTAGENSENSPIKLFENIERVAKDLAMNVISYRHRDTFCYLGEDGLIDSRARKIMLRMLSALYYPEENIKYEYKGNPLRHVLEYLFRSARKQGLLPDVLFRGDIEAVQLSSLFMAGYNVRYNENGEEKQIRWGNPSSDPKVKTGDSIFTPQIADIVNKIREFTNEESHTSEDEPWYIDEEKKDVFFGHVLLMCHVIKWYGMYVKEHPNPEENRMNHRPVNSSNKTISTKFERANKTTPPRKEDILGKNFPVLQGKNFYTAGCCKLSDDCKRKVSIGSQIIILNVIDNNDDKYPFIATEIRQV